jgi:hypothetical protein
MAMHNGLSPPAMKSAPYLFEKKAAIVIWIGTAFFTIGATLFGH